MIEPSFGANPFNLRLVQHCPVCRAESASAKVEILEELGSSFLAYLSCVRCGSSLIVRVITMPQGLVGNAILTDLSSEEVVRFSEVGAVGEDFVLGTWQALAQPSWLASLGVSRSQPRRLPRASAGE
jgi:hypothetical protein